MAAGQSLGAGQAVLIGMKHPVRRVAAFSGWTDAEHGWADLGVTPTDRHFMLIHGRDNYFVRTCQTYCDLELVLTCPLAAFPVPPVQFDANPALVDHLEPPFPAGPLVINLEPAPTPLMDPVSRKHQPRDIDSEGGRRQSSAQARQRVALDPR